MKSSNEISILIVDDTHENLKVLGNILKDNKYNVAFTDNGAQAIEIAKKIIPDLILLDVSMPDMNGFETCLKLKEIKTTREIPVIFLTARTETEDIVNGFEAGAVDYVTKPFNAKELLTRVKTHLELKKHQDMLKHEIKEKSRIQKQLEKANEELFNLSNLDGLTMIANRRRFDEYLSNELKRYKRNEAPLSLILCDVDFFKLYNDKYGHIEGDECLKQLAGTIQDCLNRPSDLLARYGGEEFAAILPNTDIQGAITIGEIIRKKVVTLNIPHADSKASEFVTVSIGAATLEKNNLSTTEKHFISLADKALYRAKKAGRNICVHSSSMDNR